MSSDRHTPGQAVGYCNPPAETRFKKGQSGNPSGRPRKKTNPEAEVASPQYFSRVIVEEYMRPVKVTENGNDTEMPAILAVLRSGTRSAIKGKPGAQKHSVELFARALNEIAQSQVDGLTQLQSAISQLGGLDQNSASKLY